VKPGDAVKMGDPIGIVGDNPIDHDARHLHWECYLGEIGKYPKGTIDPERFLRGAKVLEAQKPTSPGDPPSR
jgi:murein DD-endopeptidase MepM/ murein hydrolase activator NlpD